MKGSLIRVGKLELVSTVTRISFEEDSTEANKLKTTGSR